MILTTHPKTPPSLEICKYLQKEFKLSKQAIDLATKKSLIENAPLSIILWSYGLINLEDYQRFLDWLEARKYRN
mgnify:CR=1 FL=1